MKKLILILLAGMLSISAFAKISFGAVDLNKDNQVLFTVNQDMAGTNDYRSLFTATIKNGLPEASPKLLTCYPEQMELLNGGNVLQLRNRYGSGRYNSLTKKFSWTEVKSEIPENALPVVPYHASPDGKWICKIEKESLVSGRLVLQNTESGKTAVLCDEIRLSYTKLPVKWAPDSSVLIYEKDGSVYFCNPDAVMRMVEMDEKYRRIGRGTINSVNWANSRYLVYIDDYLVYQINAKELYTLGLYSGIIGQGKPIGRLSSAFNSATDEFSVNPSMTGFVITQKSRLFTYLVNRQKSSSVEYLDVICSKPYTDSSASLCGSYVFWDSKERPLLWLEKLPYNGKNEEGVVYRLGTTPVKLLEIENSGKPFISPDGLQVAFYSGLSIYIYNIDSWTCTSTLGGERVVSALWLNNNTLYVGGDKTVRLWKPMSDSYDTILLSSANAGYWDDDENSIVAEAGNGLYFRYDSDKGTWASILPNVYTASSDNGRYRLFTGVTKNKLYNNALYIRTLVGKSVTKPFYERSVQKVSERKKVVLAFDAYDNSDGLSYILSTLKKYKLPAVFFLNGEFIRRYPSETNQIVLNGYDVGSMFFSTTDLVNNDFIVDEDFIRRGLARNEDEFFNSTRRELSLYWHAPYFSVSPEIISSAEKAGYTYVYSWQKEVDSELLPADKKPEALIQDYCDSVIRTSGGVVPVCIGFSQGNRDDPLYNYLDLLICGLLDSGFEFVKINEE